MLKNRWWVLWTLSLQQHSNLFLLILLTNLLPQKNLLQNVSRKELIHLDVLEIIPENSDYLTLSLWCILMNENLSFMHILCTVWNAKVLSWKEDLILYIFTFSTYNQDVWELQWNLLHIIICDRIVKPENVKVDKLALEVTEGIFYKAYKFQNSGQ